MKKKMNITGIDNGHLQLSYEQLQAAYYLQGKKIANLERENGKLFNKNEDLKMRLYIIKSENQNLRKNLLSIVLSVIAKAKAPKDMASLKKAMQEYLEMEQSRVGE